MKAAGRDVKEEISQNELWKFLSDNPLRDFAKRSIPLGKDGSFPYLLPRSFAGKTREGEHPVISSTVCVRLRGSCCFPFAGEAGRGAEFQRETEHRPPKDAKRRQTNRSGKSRSAFIDGLNRRGEARCGERRYLNTCVISRRSEVWLSSGTNRLSRN